MQHWAAGGLEPAARPGTVFAERGPTSGILTTGWTRIGKTVHTCLNMVPTCLYMFMRLHTSATDTHHDEHVLLCQSRYIMTRIMMVFTY
jgi:hypothetical protein